MSLDKLVPTLEKQGQLRSAFQHAVRSLLLNNLDGLAAGGTNTTNIRKKVAAKKPVIRQLDGAGTKTDFYPLPALDEEEASVKGTICHSAHVFSTCRARPAVYNTQREERV